MNQYPLSNFNSLWEIAFAVNAIFVIFELIPILNKKLEETLAIGDSEIKEFILKEDQQTILNCGWKRIIFGQIFWTEGLKIISILCSLLALLLIIVGGFNPNLSLSMGIILIFIIIEFGPISLIPLIIVYIIPNYKLKCIDYAISKRIEFKQNGKNSTYFRTHKLKQYKYLVQYIRRKKHPFLSYFTITKGKISSCKLEKIFNKKF